MPQMNCPKGHGPLVEKKIERSVLFKGIEVNILEDAFVCPVCRLSAGTVQSAGKIQLAIQSMDRDRPTFYKKIQSVRENNMDMTGWLDYFITGLATQMVEV